MTATTSDQALETSEELGMMTDRIGILTIHGMGEEKQNFDHQLKRGLLRELGAESYARLCIRSIWFHPAISSSQKDVAEKMKRSGLRCKGLRDFALFSLSDVTAYDNRADAADSVYRRVHQLILDRIHRLGDELPAAAPVIVIAHSLGCQVISNYIWDAQQTLMSGRRAGIWDHPLNRNPTTFEALGSIRYLLTSGCNIPLFVSGFPQIEAIHRPNPGFRWVNYFDKDDILGWPLKPLSRGFANSYDEVVTEDVPINVGFTPLGHLNYWKSRQFVDAVAERIKEVLESL